MQTNGEKVFFCVHIISRAQTVAVSVGEASIRLDLKWGVGGVRCQAAPHAQAQGRTWWRKRAFTDGGLGFRGYPRSLAAIASVFVR